MTGIGQSKAAAIKSAFLLAQAAVARVLREFPNAGQAGAWLPPKANGISTDSPQPCVGGWVPAIVSDMNSATEPSGAERLRLHSFLPRSRANGPGWRAVVWVQGCTLGCPDCFNPATHSPHGGELVSVDEVYRRIQAAGPGLEGVTLSGGEPLQQRAAVLALLERVRRETALSALVFTGFTWEEVQRMPEPARLLGGVDVLIAGRYDARQPCGRALLGSANQTLHFVTHRYSVADLDAVPAAEIVLGPDGLVSVTGLVPPALRDAVDGSLRHPDP